MNAGIHFLAITLILVLALIGLDYMDLSGGITGYALKNVPSLAYVSAQNPDSPQKPVLFVKPKTGSVSESEAMPKKPLKLSVPKSKKEFRGGYTIIDKNNKGGKKLSDNVIIAGNPNTYKFNDGKSWFFSRRLKMDLKIKRIFESFLGFKKEIKPRNNVVLDTDGKHGSIFRSGTKTKSISFSNTATKVVTPANRIVKPSSRRVSHFEPKTAVATRVAENSYVLCNDYDGPSFRSASFCEDRNGYHYDTCNNEGAVDYVCENELCVERNMKCSCSSGMCI
ncbi:hypothetical protein D6745_04785 [Candidatus Woesearchaeota archaeon]|nr:MAG: hypothetical protein D6745_04785 [Candidatus Woesearchaeota archaeon]